MFVCIGRGADLHMAQLMPLSLTNSCSIKSRLVLHFCMVPAHSGSPRQRAIKQVLLLLLWMAEHRRTNVHSQEVIQIAESYCYLQNKKLCATRHKYELEIISIGIPPPPAPPGESFCIKTGNQIGGWVYSRFDHVIHGGPKYTNF